VKPWFALFCVGLALWTGGWVLIDWVLNSAVYQGMEAPVWLLQVPFSPAVVYVSGWHAYQIGFIQCHIALVIFVYAVAKLIGA